MSLNPIDPSKLVPMTFLGHSVGGGVSPAFRDVLAAVDAQLRQECPPGADFVAWCGAHTIGGWRKAPSGWHGAGTAIDIDYNDNGYCATRTGTVYGGEYAAAQYAGLREAALAACDRASMAKWGRPADLSAWKPGEDVGLCWDRFHEASDAVKAYFAPYYSAVEQLCHGQNMLLPNVQISMVPKQVQEDYDAIRIPLVVGSPTPTPRITRNPARGLMNLQRHVVVAMCAVGKCRWGAISFGAHESGDIMHFDRTDLR